MLLAELVATSAAVTATSKRIEKVALLAVALRKLAPEEVIAGVAYLSGELRQRQIGVGWASLRELLDPSASTPTGSVSVPEVTETGSPELVAASVDQFEVTCSAETAGLTVADVDAGLTRIGSTTGAGSQALRRQLLSALFGQATEIERQFLGRLLIGELRQGALAGVMTDAIAKASEVPIAAVRRALLLSGDLRAVAQAALTGGELAVAEFRLVVGRPLAPMLAKPAPGLAQALELTCPAAVEHKLDGIRVQVHRRGEEIRIFTRSLDEITARLPEVVELVRGLEAQTLVLDGEVVALNEYGRPRPFQITASRVGQRGDPSGPRAKTPLSPLFFDLLHRDGVDLLDVPSEQRWSELEAVAPASLRVRRSVVDNLAAAELAYAQALEAGHEGVVVKALGATYAAGRRGAGWVKVKPRHTLDLVVLAVEWGHGRRRGWLSNLHLGARDPSGGFVMLGKTFKGLTDELLRWQTERLRALAVSESEWTVQVRPELVVEVAFDGVQASSRYPGGVALRFARVLRYREDKSAVEADTMDTVRELHTRDTVRELHRIGSPGSAGPPADGGPPTEEPRAGS
jgi:DNA ligase-1